MGCLALTPITHALHRGGIARRMSLIGLLVVLVVIGVALALLNQIPMAPPIRNIITIVAVLVAILFVLECFGVLTGPVLFTHVRVR